jgi:hypothetical protein
MKYLLTLLCLLSAAVPARADLFDFLDFRGWSPRYMYVEDDNMIGHHHYFGVAYYTPQGKSGEGLTARIGLGNHGDKVNIGYSAASSFFAVDIGFSYSWVDADQYNDYDNPIEGLGLELGLRFWVINFVGVHTEETSFVSLGYGF